jgi:hypothetical protein
MAAMETTKQVPKSRYPLTTRRLVAVSLLLVLLTGLSITDFTDGWIAYLPFHDHLIVNARAIGLVHHAHHGDALAQAQRNTRSFDSAYVPGQPHQDGVLSLRPLSAQPELNTTSATGWGGGFALPLPPSASAYLLLAALLLAVGRTYAPPSPPPRFA